MAALWRRSLPTKATPPKGEAYGYEIAKTGPVNYTMPAGKAKIDADGFRPNDGEPRAAVELERLMKEHGVPGRVVVDK